MIEKTPEFETAWKLIETTNQHLFLTGKAGTGKTTFLKQLLQGTSKRTVVVAPTGVAAINAGGMTIHSFFQINFGPFVPGQKSAELHKIRKEKLGIMRTMDLLIIDEVSMVRADLMHAIDDVLKRIRRDNRPFGGVQLLMIGDTQQLTPVVRDEEKNILGQYYETPYFFSSRALKNTNYSCIELTKIFRQEDEHFIQLLNAVRENKASQNVIDEINEHYHPNFTPKDGEGYIQLTTHNYSAQRINESKLNGLKGKEHAFPASTTGIFPESNYPNDALLKLKEGAQIMFVKNDSSSEKRYFNGKIGWVKEFMEDGILVTDHEKDILVDKETWENVRYTLEPETNAITTQVEGTFSQYPLKTAWAITVHKSQGLTFEKAIIDAKDSFSHGQVYVALSRCKTLAGMVLSTPLSLASIKHDMRVELFNNTVKLLTPTDTRIAELQKEYKLQLLAELFSFRPLAAHANAILRLLTEHLYRTYPELIRKLDAAKIEIEEKLLSVSVRFHVQLQNYSDNEKLLQERCIKGSRYFIDTCSDIFPSLIEKIREVRSANKEVQKKITERLSQLENDYSVKMATLETCTNGFDSKSYLIAKNNAEAEAALQPSPKQKQKTGGIDDILHPELFERLRIWRKEESEKEGLPPYIVLSQTALVNISNFLPTTGEALLSISGIGSKTAERYGAELLTITEECMLQYDYDKPEATQFVKVSTNKKTKGEKNEKMPKESTYETTLHLFESDKLSIDEIAQKRGLARGTIESHLCKLIKDGTLQVSDLTSQDRLDKLKDYIAHHSDQSSKEIVEALNNEYTYNELKLAKWQMEKAKE